MWMWLCLLTVHRGTHLGLCEYWPHLFTHYFISRLTRAYTIIYINVCVCASHVFFGRLFAFSLFKLMSTHNHNTVIRFVVCFFFSSSCLWKVSSPLFLTVILHVHTAQWQRFNRLLLLASGSWEPTSRPFAAPNIETLRICFPNGKMEWEGKRSRLTANVTSSTMGIGRNVTVLTFLSILYT